jgi:hypothetical protein
MNRDETSYTQQNYLMFCSSTTSDFAVGSSVTSDFVVVAPQMRRRDL